MAIKKSAYGFKNILCSVAFKGHSKEALKHAAGLARQNNAVLHVMHVIEHVPALALYDKKTLNAFVEEMQDKAMKYLKTVLKDHSRGLKIQPVVVYGHAAEEIIKYANKKKNESCRDRQP